jgi:TolA-binding protein
VEFRSLDTDADGYVNGADVRQPLMASGLSQQTLAQIWALVDIHKTGRINMEQFTLVMELIKEAHKHIPLPPALPPHLIPPSLRLGSPSSAGGMAPAPPSVVTTPVHSQPPPLTAHLDDANPRVQELNSEIEKIQENRREAERDLAQLEADTTIKNSEIKNLEIELSTLSSTAKQLRHQKGEAGKRLAELDDRIEKLESTFTEEQQRVTEEEDRLANVKKELAQSKDNASVSIQLNNEQWLKLWRFRRKNKCSKRGMKN